MRFSYFYEFRSSPYYGIPIVDGIFYTQQAESILSGNIIESEPFQKAPFYSYLLAFFMFISGTKFFFFLTFQILLSTANCLLIYRLSKRFLTDHSSLAAGLISACYIPFIFYSVELLRPTFLNFFFLLFIEVLYIAREKRNSLSFLVAGIIAGLVSITKATGLMLVFLTLLWIITNKWSYYLRRSLKAKFSFMLMFLVGVFLIIAPVTIRNLTFSNDIILISSNGGINFFSGNNKYSDGTTPILPGIMWSRVMKIQYSMPFSNAAEISSAWWEKGIYFLIQNTEKGLTLYLKKFLLFINNMELRNNKDIDFSKKFSVILNLPFPGFGIIFSLSILGIFLSLKDYDKFIFIYFVPLITILVNLIFFTCSRYRITAVPFLIIFAFYFIEYFISLVQKKDLLNLSIVILFLAALLIITHQNIWPIKNKNFSREYFNLGNIYSARQKFKTALKCHFMAAKLKPDDPDPYLAAGVISEKLQNTKNARIAYKKTLSLAPDHLDALINLSSILIREKKFKEAVTLLINSKKHDLIHPLIHFNMATCLDLLGKHKAAVREYRNSLNLGGPKAAIYNNIGYLYLKRRTKLPEAVKLLKKAIELEPNNHLFLDSLGLGYFLTKDYEKSVVILQKAIKICSTNPIILFHLAQSLFKLEKHNEAFKYAQIIIKYYSKTPEAKRAELLIKAINSSNTSGRKTIKE